MHKFKYSLDLSTNTEKLEHIFNTIKLYEPIFLGNAIFMLYNYSHIMQFIRHLQS